MKLLIPVVTFFGGLVIGVGSMYIFHERATQAMIENCNEVVLQQDHNAVLINVVYATLLHDQKYADLNGLIEVNMGFALNRMKSPDYMDRYQGCARLVRGYYNLSGTSMPSQLGSALSNVTGSDVRRLAYMMADPKNVRAAREVQ